MKAKPLIQRRIVLGSEVFVEIRLWEVPQPVRGSRHHSKYSLALVARGNCVLRYDNEAGKGDHRHLGATEEPYLFVDIERLLADFERDVRRWLDEHRDA